MAEVLPVVCIFGVDNVQLYSASSAPVFETTQLDCRCYLTDDDLNRILATDRPSVIVSFGPESDFPHLQAAPSEIRKQWLRFDDTSSIDAAGVAAFEQYLRNATSKESDMPLVTVFTPAYKTGEKIMRPLRSLQAQTYSNWEWVIMDDSDDDGDTFQMLTELSEDEHRMRVYRECRHSGVIGHIKRGACMLGRGEILVEMDHDDELTPKALEYVVKAFEKHPECGFVYTDFAECFEDGTPVSYGQDMSKRPPYSDWGHGYGSYRRERHGGQDYLVVNAPNINAKTIRHIVAAPNHIRAWRRAVYNEIGGHGDLIHVADDYELMVRTFLTTRMCRVPELCYVQYRNFEAGNTHQERNKEIQRLVRYFSMMYDKRIHARLMELGVDDFVWQDGKVTFCEMQEIINLTEESHCTVMM